MTDASARSAQQPGSVLDRKPDLSAKRVKRRYAAEARFRAIGLGAILAAMAVLATLVSTIVSQGLPAFTQYDLDLPVYLDPTEIDADNLNAANYQALVRRSLYERFPEVTQRREKRKLAGLISSGADIIVKSYVESHPDRIGTTQILSIPAADDIDTYLKGQMTDILEFTPQAELSPTGVSGDVQLLASGDVFAAILADTKILLEVESSRLMDNARREQLGIDSYRAEIKTLQVQLEDALGARRETIEDRISALDAQANRRVLTAAQLNEKAANLSEVARSTGGSVDLTDEMPSIFLEVNGGLVKANRVSSQLVEGTVIHPLTSAAPAAAGEWKILELTTPESNRRVKDREAAWLHILKSDNIIESRFATVMFTSGDSREPELAGIWGAVVGSFLTLFITLSLSFPVGVLAAIYLEEFAPQNRLTDLIEVNINNLAAVPSIVFGLLGLAMFLNFFGLPRSAPLVGGMVLALMTLPTIIIATRAALKAVPPSIREAALGIGASKVQVITHHVLPLAMPGVLTGTIIGMAQALGETAPLLMIGMVAFIVDIPGGFTDPATVLPVQIYIWADSPERAFVAKTSAAIMVLLTFLVMMNALAVLLRRRFERRW